MCPTESQFIRLVAGELPEDQATQLRAHTAECGVCRKLLAQHQLTWDMLGNVASVPPGRDLAPAMLAAAERRWGVMSPRRIAAAVFIAIGAGVAVGTAMPVHRPVPFVQSSDPEAVMNALGFDAVAADDGGLSSLLATPADSETQEQPS